MQKKKATGIFSFFSQVFSPLIPVFAGSGLLVGLKQICVLLFTLTGASIFNSAPIANGGSMFMAAFTVLCSTFFSFLNIAVAMQAAKVIGGNPYLGLVAGGIIMNVGNLSGASLGFLGLTFINGRGGTLAALASGALIAVVEKWIRKRTPDTFKIHLPALGSIAVVGLLTMFILQPVFGFVSDIFTRGLVWLLDNAGPVGGAAISFMYLPLVMTGMHHGLTPLHASLIQTLGYTPLFAFNSMAGGGQVGAAIALFFKYRKNRQLQNAVKGGLPAGILGIGEPLIFGVSLPLGRVFITACLGAGIGGLFLGFFKQGAIAMNVSGILGTLVNISPLTYLGGYVISIVSGFIITYFVGAKASNLANFEPDIN
jgi:PTS system sucrose-specific IIC component